MITVKEEMPKWKPSFNQCYKRPAPPDLPAGCCRPNRGMGDHRTLEASYCYNCCTCVGSGKTTKAHDNARGAAECFLNAMNDLENSSFYKNCLIHFN